MFEDDPDGFIGQDCRVSTFKLEPQGLLLGGHHFAFFNLQGSGYNITK